MRLAPLGTATVAGLVATALVSATPAWSAGSGDRVWLDFEGTPPGDAVTRLDNAGTSGVTITVVRKHGGEIVARQPAATGSGSADFPAYDGARDGARAVISVTSAGTKDELEPFRRPFSWGVDVRVDATSQGDTTYDNGNNLVQRGLYGDRAQFKLEEDGGRFTCRAKGAEGALDVSSSVDAQAGVWYRVRCTRQVLDGGDRVVVAVRTITAPGEVSAATVTRSRIAPIGNLDFSSSTPLSVGGKLSDRRTVHQASDQFNGLLDNAFLHVS